MTRIKKARRAKASATHQPGPRGWPGPGGGRSTYVQAAPQFRGTTVQVCGLWPFAAGAGSPMVGVPIGRNLLTGATLCCDPISWFQRARLISNPSVFVLGKPGLGKSTIVRRMVLGLAGYGVVPFVLGDLKPDYVDLVEALGGQVVSLGSGRGYLNVLDPGQAGAAAARLTGRARQAVLADAHARRTTMVAALITILRSTPPSDREETILDRGLTLLDERHNGVPVLADLLQVIREAPDDVRAVALDRGELSRYRDITEDLEATLLGMISGGRFAGLFSQQTTTPMRHDRAVVFDVSSIDDAQTDLQAAVLLACWSAGFGTVNVAHALADAGLEPRRHYFVVLDELWRALRAGRGMVDRVDALTRLNRQRGVGMAMISHTMGDLQSLASEQDRVKARGFVERSGMVVCGGLPAETGVDGRGSSGPDQQGIDDHDPEGSDESWPPDWPDLPDGAPSWWLPPLEPVTAEDFSAIQTAEQVTAAFARPAPGSDGRWWPKVRPLMSGQGVADYESVDPREVGHTTVTGPGQLVQVFAHTPIAGVDVPTDGGIYRVMLEPDDRKPTGWAVTSIRPVEAHA